MIRGNLFREYVKLKEKHNKFMPLEFFSCMLASLLLYNPVIADLLVILASFHMLEGRKRGNKVGKT